MMETLLIIVVSLIVAGYGAWQSAHARHVKEMGEDRRHHDRRRD